MIKILKNINVYSPDPIGKKDILIADSRIAAIEEQIDPPSNLPGLEIIDGQGMIAVPGFVDSHVHIMGGGGEAGFSTRTDQMTLTQATLGGVTSVIGVRGTDGISRSMEGFVAKARGLKEEGISCWVLTGSYQVPVITITERIESDIMMISEVIGVGEIAISDHRSSQPTFDEIARVAAAARIGGMLSKKAGVVNIHVGDGERGISMLKDIIRKTEIPFRQFIPTHMNRNSDLFEEGIVYARDGGYLDFTTSSVPQFFEEGETKCSRALKRCLERGVPVERITFSSDGQGSMPSFDDQGDLTGFHVGDSRSLYPEVRDAVLEDEVPIETAIRVITSSPASAYKLPRKGYLKQGFDADIVLLNPEDMAIRTVLALGQVMVKDGEALVKGTFE